MKSRMIIAGAVLCLIGSALLTYWMLTQTAESDHAVTKRVRPDVLRAVAARQNEARRMPGTPGLVLNEVHWNGGISGDSEYIELDGSGELPGYTVISQGDGVLIIENWDLSLPAR